MRVSANAVWPAPGEETKASFIEAPVFQLFERTNPIRPFAIISLCNKQSAETARVFYQMDMLACAVSHKIINATPTLTVVARQVQVCHRLPKRWCPISIYDTTVFPDHQSFRRLIYPMIVPNEAVVMRELKSHVKMPSVVFATIQPPLCRNKQVAAIGNENSQNGPAKNEHFYRG
jgi:hypothetical protein